MAAVPITTPTTLPAPPKIDTPPITAPAIESIS